MTTHAAEKSFRVNNFDLLRICAAFQVLTWHSIHHLQLDVPQQWESLLGLFPGVPIFFVISGYLISASYERTGNLLTYLRNRCVRIYPGLWACIAVTVVVAAVVGRVDFVNRQTIPWLLCQFAGAIYTPQFLSGFGFGSYNGSLWTIPIELQFYLLLPIIYAVCEPRRRSILWFMAMLALFVTIAYWLGVMSNAAVPTESLGNKLIRYTCVPHFYMFLVGVVLQRLQVHRSRLVHGKGVYWLAGYLLVAYFSPGATGASPAAQMLLAMCTVSLAYTRPTLAGTVLRGNDISYGVYMYHGLVLDVLVERHKMHDPIYFLLTIVATLALGYASWVLVERPFLKKKRALIGDVLPVGSEPVCNPG
jgi:peptidoglycan/LPS O-acetylase OafA/YrhL